MLPIYYCRCRLEAGTLAAHQGLFRHAGPAHLFEPSRDASDGHHTFGVSGSRYPYVESVIHIHVTLSLPCASWNDIGPGDIICCC